MYLANVNLLSLIERFYLRICQMWKRSPKKRKKHKKPGYFRHFLWTTYDVPINLGSRDRKSSGWWTLASFSGMGRYVHNYYCRYLRRNSFFSVMENDFRHVLHTMYYSPLLLVRRSWCHLFNISTRFVGLQRTYISATWVGSLEVAAKCINS